MTQPSAFDLQSTYVHLQDGPAAVPMQGGDEFWRTIDRRTELNAGRLVCAFTMAEDWPYWEMHPAGDEIVYLMSGAIDLVLDDGAGERTVALRGKGGCIVPRGTWHRALVHQPSEVLFVTRGEGTQHRPA